MIERSLRLMYSIGLVCLLPLMLMRLLWKARINPAYRQRVFERLHVKNTAGQTVDIWLHAVSLGEVVAATPIIEHFLAKNYRVLVTTMTPAGSQQVQRRFASRVLHKYLPYDLPWMVRRFFQIYRPRIAIIMETELWPNLVFMASRANIPLFLANARISNKAFKQYKHLRWFFRTTLRRFNLIMAQSELDARRLMHMGADDKRVQVLGNIKFDLPLPHDFPQELTQLQKTWGATRPVLIAASTHADEEQQLLSILPTLQQSIPGLLLLIAPRHSERFATVFSLCTQQGFKTGRRSETNTLEASCEVIVLDSMGELLAFYALSHYAFVGGSLVPIGGHNVLEPIALNVPVFCGPFMHNSQSLIDELITAQAIRSVANSEALARELITLHHDLVARETQINNARALWLANQGAVLRHIERMECELQD